MKQTIGWVSRNVLLPLLPFIVGACIRSVHLGQLSLEIVDPAELSFSMAMVCILANRGAGKLTDKPLSDTLTSLYFVCIVLFLALFTYAAVVRLQLESSMNKEIMTLSDLLKQIIASGTTQGKQVPSSAIADSFVLINRVQTFAVVTSAVVLPLTVFFKYFYELED